jgi:predicted nucleic acid-binding protein
MIVADNTLLCHFFLRGELGEFARRVRAKDGDWIVPPLWRSEFANAIVKAYWACPDPLELYCKAWDFAWTAMSPCERQVDFHDVIRIGAQKHISGYDAQYAHLALKYRVQLVTEDGPLQRAFPGIAVSMKDFLGIAERPKVVRESRASYRVRRKR